MSFAYLKREETITATDGAVEEIEKANKVCVELGEKRKEKVFCRLCNNNTSTKATRTASILLELTIKSKGN